MTNLPRLRCLLTLLVLLTAILLPSSVCQAFSKNEEAAIQKLKQFYTKMGDKTALGNLEKQLKNNKIVFGTPQDPGALGEINMGFWSREITINKIVVDNPNSLNDFKTMSQFAETMYHEMVHADQSNMSWVASSYTEGKYNPKSKVWREGYNPCEQEAWAATTNNYVGWLEQQSRIVDSLANKPIAQQVEASRQLEDMLKNLETTINAMADNRKANGPITLKGWDSKNKSVTPSQFFAYYQKKYLGQVNHVLAKASLGGYSSIEGIYYSHYKGKVPNNVMQVVFKVSGSNVTGRVNLCIEENGVVKVSMNGTINGTINSNRVIRASITGNKTVMGQGIVIGNKPGSGTTIDPSNTNPFSNDDVTTSITGDFTGEVTKKCTASGTCTLGYITQKWSAARQQTRR